MKATGIVRRVDELGRIVIPKEIRRTLRINEGDEVEIYTSGDELVLKRYSTLGALRENAQEYADIAYASIRKNVLITDTQMVIAGAGDRVSSYLGKRITSTFLETIGAGQPAKNKEDSKQRIVLDDSFFYQEQLILPLEADGELYGSLVLLSSDAITDIEGRVARNALDFLRVAVS